MLMIALATGTQAAPEGAPLALHPDNPHYLLFRDKPTVLVTGTEHYGAVLNLDFDYTRYLDELARCGLNLTRTFSGAYMEHSAAFGIAGNTLAPQPGRLICPWARNGEDGYAGGGAKFDLHQWDDAYFERLRDFCTNASERGIVVEYVLFCPFYGDEQWGLSPMNAANNVNGIGNAQREEVYALKHTDLQTAQEAFVRKAVRELAKFDNIYYEICNEPYFGGVTEEWQRRIADVIAEAEQRTGVRHLIAKNIANGSAVVADPPAPVSILNFHYATPPDAVGANWGLHLATADDETGFRGTADKTYRSEAWHFMLAGGAIFDHLDYSFSPGYEDGTFEYPDSQPGGGSRALREELAVLKRLIESCDFVRMAPDPDAIADPLPEGVSWQALSEPGEEYVIYVEGGTGGELTLTLPDGRYRCEWISTITGTPLATAQSVTGGAATLTVPEDQGDAALKVTRRRQ